MNKERLRKLAQRLDKTAPERFDMRTYCGTVCCIGGHARMMARGHWPVTFDGARNYLGLDVDTAWNLMEPENVETMEHVKPKQAAKVIRNLIKTGIVEWEKFV